MILKPFTLHGFHSKNFKCKFEYEPNVQEIIETADMVEGIPFISLEQLKIFKEVYGREKDRKDVELIDKYLKSIEICV